MSLNSIGTVLNDLTQLSFFAESWVSIYNMGAERSIHPLVEVSETSNSSVEIQWSVLKSDNWTSAAHFVVVSLSSCSCSKFEGKNKKNPKISNLSNSNNNIQSPLFAETIILIIF